MLPAPRIDAGASLVHVWFASTASKTFGADRLLYGSFATSRPT